MKMMLLFEIRKIFSRFKNRFAALLLLIVLGITSILAINKVEYVDENGNSTTGITAAANLRAVREPWSGYLTEEVLKKASEFHRYKGAEQGVCQIAGIFRNT